MNLVDTRIGNYVIRRELGAGGMGTVYLAEHPGLGKRVAIKVLHEDNARDPDTVARFFQEARAAAEIGHENIIDVLDVGELEVDGAPVTYLMMELLDGVSLGKYLRDRLPDEAEIRHILLQCCSALAASHQHGIVHRDLKPENIYLVKRGGDDHFVKVLDFGIAKLLAGRPGSGRTRIGTILGTPHYMSPEQCRGRGDVDPRSDVYALGVVLYEMLCGQVPFEGTLGEVLQAQVQAVPVPPSQRFPQVPAGLEAIAMRCLEKDKTARFQTMDELAEALRDPAAHLASRPQPVAAPPRAAPDAPTLHLAPITASIPPLERHARLGRELRAWVLPLAIGLITALVLAGGSVYLRGWLDQRVMISAPARR